MKQIVRLRSVYTDRGGGTSYPGERVGIEPEVARRLIASGAAEAVDGDTGKRAVDSRAVKPASEPQELKGLAKLNWYRERIREAGGKPKGRTQVELMAQYEALG